MKTEQLKNRVAYLKKKLKDNNVKASKIKFFDEFYGALYKQESIRLDNLWAGYIADETFTEQLEQFVVNLKIK